MKKIIEAADLFCGAGGMTSGLLEAAAELGIQVNLTAVNHWPTAIDTHTANHPAVKHLCQSVQSLHPWDVFPAGKLDILVASPDCIHFSRARGGRPVNKQSRASGWDVLRWCEAIDIRSILIENVPEYADWGPVKPRRITDKKTGKQRRVYMPDPKRKGEIFEAFIEALKSIGYKVEWTRRLNCANYGDPTTRERLFIMARKGRAPQFPMPSHSKPSIVDKQPSLLFNTKPWKTARDVIDWSVESTSIFERKKPLVPNTIRRIVAGLRKFGGIEFVIGQQNWAAPRDVDQRLPTVAGADAISLVQPFVLPNEGVYGGNAPRSIDDPINGLTASRGAGHLVQPVIVSLRGTAEDQLQSSSRSVDEPMPTVTGGNHTYLASPVIVPYYTERNDQEPRSHSIDVPLPTVVGDNRFALVEPFITAFNHGGDTNGRCPVDEPFKAVTSVGAWGLIEAFLIKYNGTGGAMSIGDPLDTVTAVDRFGLVESFLSKARGIPVVLSDGSHVLLDIHFRMFQPHELAAAQSFPKHYIFTGNKRDRVKQIGNAVPVQTAKALCRALLT